MQNSAKPHSFAKRRSQARVRERGGATGRGTGPGVIRAGSRGAPSTTGTPPRVMGPERPDGGGSSADIVQRNDHNEPHVPISEIDRKGPLLGLFLLGLLGLQTRQL